MKTILTRNIYFILTALSITGCATYAPQTSSASFLREPAIAQAPGPIYVWIVDERPAAQLQASGVRDQYRYAREGLDAEQGAQTLAQNMIRIIEAKGLSRNAVVETNPGKLPSDAVRLRIRLDSWWGRVMDGTYTEKVFRNTAFQAEGHCRITAHAESASIIRLGTMEGRVTFKTSPRASAENEGRRAAAAAADEAVAACLRRLEQHLGKAY